MAYSDMGDHNYYVSFLRQNKGKKKHWIWSSIKSENTTDALFLNTKFFPFLTVKIKTIRPRYCHVSNPQKFDPPVVQLALKIKLLANYSSQNYMASNMWQARDTSSHHSPAKAANHYQASCSNNKMVPRDLQFISTADLLFLHLPVWLSTSSQWSRHVHQACPCVAVSKTGSRFKVQTTDLLPPLLYHRKRPVI
jgi:hypothetical protein